MNSYYTGAGCGPRRKPVTTGHAGRVRTGGSGGAPGTMLGQKGLQETLMTCQEGGVEDRQHDWL
jgi:hypothetical protein